MVFNTKVQGVGCQCLMLCANGIPFVPQAPGAKMNAPYAFPKMIFQLLDKNGFPASWLQKLMTESDVNSLMEEFFLERDAEAYSYAH